MMIYFLFFFFSQKKFLWKTFFFPSLLSPVLGKHCSLFFQAERGQPGWLQERWGFLTLAEGVHKSGMLSSPIQKTTDITSEIHTGSFTQGNTQACYSRCVFTRNFCSLCVLIVLLVSVWEGRTSGSIIDHILLDIHGLLPVCYCKGKIELGLKKKKLLLGGRV